MATRTIAKTDKWTREQYQEKPLVRTTSAAPDWAWGCELCNYGVVKGTVNTLCTCRAGQARGRWASGNMAPLDEPGDIVVNVPTMNAAYGGD